MSECVVRMEMPKGCGSCSIANFGYCSINNKQVGDPLMGYPENRPANCPILCQLPEEHGRLVDADKFIAHLFAKWQDGWISNSEWCDIRQRVNEETTIVPADTAERSET